MKRRTAQVKRKTRETDISIELDLDGKGQSKIDTGVGFMDHMLELFSKHSLIDLKIRARGDTQVDDHHTVEDIGLALGQALDKALGTRRGITRYGWCLLPMDDAMSRVAIDLGGRPYLVYDIANRTKRIGTFEVGLINEFMQAFCIQGRMNLHIAQLYGKDAHHAYESVFKGLARAMRIACTRDSRVRGVPSSKGKV